MEGGHALCCEFAMVDGKRYTVKEIRESTGETFDYIDSMTVRCTRPLKVNEDDGSVSHYRNSRFRFTFRCCLDPECSEYEEYAAEDIVIIEQLHGDVVTACYISLGDRRYKYAIDGLLNYDGETYEKVIAEMRKQRRECKC